MAQSLLIVLSLLLCRSAVGIRRVEEVECYNTTVELVVKRARVTVDDIVTFNTRLYHYKEVAMLPGPTIKMAAGSWCTVRIVNQLVGEVCPSEHTNGYHCPDTTTLHTHGLHVSPFEDNIDTHIQPKGDSHDYTYHIVEDHPMGTNWYHAHHHGSTTFQAMGGMAGILLLEPSPSYRLPSDLAELYEDSTIPPLMLNHVMMGGSDPDAGVGVFAFFDQEGLAEQYKEETFPLDVEWGARSVVTGKDFYVVNGEYNPVLTFPARTATLLRLVHGVGVRQITLGVLPDSGNCTVTLLARDGVFHYTPYLNLSSISLPPGSRADVSVYCTEPTKARVYASNDIYFTPSLDNSHVQHHVMEFNVVDSGSVRDIPTSEASLPDYMQSLVDVPAKEGGETGVTKFTFGRNNINGVSFRGWDVPPSERYLEEFCLGDVYQMHATGGGLSIINSDGPVLSTLPPHPYHQHVNHFQVVDTGGDTHANIIRKGEWRDTVPAWGGVGVTFRFRPMHYVGDVVLHCHITQHEDVGMMGLMHIKDCSKALNQTADTSSSSFPVSSRTGLYAVVLLGILATAVAAASSLRARREGYAKLTADSAPPSP